jgi:hypothetical protein
MKTFLKLTIVFTILLFACNAWAQNRPECITIANAFGFPVPQPPDRGVCFWSPEPGSAEAATIFYVYDGENLIIIMSDALGENNFSRLDPQLKGKFHAHDMDGVTAYLCSQDAATCLTNFWLTLFGLQELEDFWFIGPGKLSANGASPTGLTLTCPYEIRFRGTVTANDESGNEYKLQAFTTYVIDHNPPDPNAVCREAMTKISIDLVD